MKIRVPGEPIFDFNAMDTWAEKTPAERHRILEEQNALHARSGSRGPSPVALAIVQNEFLEKEIVVAIRDSSSTPPRLLVLSEHALHGDALYLGTAALELDEKEVSHLKGRRVLNVWDDGRVLSESDGSTMQLDLTLFPAGEKSDISGFLEQGAQSTTTINLPGLGQGRLLRF